ncbi:MAG TPA: SusC/RagA family TonB-linked outer membrane protein [Puia sp.]|nr:SusC/RagA family TonB-linked outer membrane protein [Puia sp.]
MRKILLLMACICVSITQLLAQNRTVTGKITDDKGAPLPNATILVKSNKTLFGASANSDGTFSLSVPSSARTLVVSAINFQSVELSIGDKGVINFTLSPTNNKLDEVVVVGYGTQKKSANTSSIAKVSGDKLENRPFTSVDQMLQGASAGLQSTATTGQPGAAQAIRIRGVGSFTYGGAQPLYVVDGVQINGGDLANGNGVTTSGSGSFNINPSTNVLATMNANDIESITVLKDAAATAIYGSRGANGVIVITTKSGKQGKAQFRFDTEVGQNRSILPPAEGRPLRKDNWLMLLREGMVNAGTFTDASITSTLHSYGDTTNIDTDWLGLITRKATQQQYNLSVSGGESKIKYFLSGGYFKQQGTTIGTDLQRVTGDMKITYTANDRLTLTTKITGGNVVQNSALASSGTSGGGGYFGNPNYVATTLRPTQNPFNADGTLNIATGNNYGFPSHYNPLYIAAHDKRWLKAFQGLANQSVNYKILEGLKFTTTMGLQYATDEEYQYNNPFHGDASGSSGEGISYYTRNFLWDWTNQLDYHYDINTDKKFYVDAKAGYESIKNNYFQQAGDVTGFPPNSDLYLSTNGATSTNGKVSGSNYTFQGYFASATVGYGDRYSLYGSIRRDASSRFSSNQRWGTFASVGVAWNISNEAFFENILPVVSNLKIRGSYGNNGNAEIGNYTWRQTYGYGYNYNGVAGGRFDNIGNPNLTWEKSKQTDVGIDVSFLKSRINITADYYKRVTKDALLSQQISRTTGFTGFINNVGDLENKGYELTLNVIPVQTRDFVWEVNFNLSHNKNMVTKLPAGDQANPQSSSFLLRKGNSIYSFYTRGWAGVNPDDGTPSWYTDSTKKTTTNNRAVAALFLVGKQADPKYFGALGSTVTFKGISLAFDFYYNYGNYFQEGYAQYFLDGTYATRGKYTENLKRWQKKGDVTDVPKYVYNSTANSGSGSDRLLYKGDYIRLRNVQLGYRVTSKSLMQAMRISALNIYVRGSNLWRKTYDKDMVSDPEQGVLGMNNQEILLSKSFTAGLNITF